MSGCRNAYSQEPEIKFKQQASVPKDLADGQIRTPHSLAVDGFGHIYVGDTGNKRVEKFYPNGTFL